MIFKHIIIQVFKEKPKTKVFKILSKHDNSELGFVYWYGQWRQYVYDPDMNQIIWSYDCLKELTYFINSLNNQHKLNLKEVKDE